MNDGKGNLSCKIHTARNEKDIYRICPSKLSKRELEDLYFALLEQNVHLKKTINDQREQVKVLNTRVQRMTLKPGMGAHKDCSASGKGIINEQKECIADLKKANERLSERIRLLNMRLCSAKQFLRRSPSQSASRCTKCLVPNASVKNLSMSALNSKRSEANVKTEISTSQFEKENTPVQLAEITSSQAEIPVQDKSCQRNECRVEIDELKKKIASLEDEMTSLQSEWSCRAGELQSLLSTSRAAHAACPDRLETLTNHLGSTRAQADELSSQLQLERSRVSELKTQLRAAQLDYDMVLAADNIKNQQYKLSDVSKVNPPVTVPSDWEDSPPIVVPNNSGISVVEENNKAASPAPATEQNKNKFCKEEKEAALQKQGDLILSQIVSLQSQLDGLKLTIVERPAETLATESSLSHDIFSTSRLKTVNDMDKVPRPSLENDILDSKDTELASRSQDKNNKYEHGYKYQIPGPLCLDMPRMSLGGVTDIKVNNETKNRNSESSRSSKGSVRINLDNVKMNKEGCKEEDNRIRDCLNRTSQMVQDTREDSIEEGYKKNRRSSLKSSAERKQSKELAVRYGETQTYSRSGEKDDKKNTQETDTEKDYEERGNEQNRDRVSTRKIRYVNEGGRRKPEDVGVQCDGGEKRGSRDLGDVTAYTQNYGLQETTAPDNVNKVRFCSSYAVVCTCGGAGLSPRLVRTCTGGQAAAPLHTLNYCRCGDRGHMQTPGGSVLPEPPVMCPAASPEDRTVTLVPAASPVHTEGEVSSITDLPKTEDTTPSDYISPGEEKGTSTLSESHVTTDSGSLSEGEVLAGGKRLSASEDKMFEAMGTRSEKMEEALRAISEELSRCRELLQSRGRTNNPKPSREVSVMTEDAVPIALRRAEAKFRIRDSYTPKCIFTLHVGTVVLSDQAVLHSRDKSLLLSWRFYNQTPSTTRVLAGRVMNFDFSTEYDLKITEHFLYYLKHEEMPISISEIDKQDEAFATCVLPLRDALLHPNRRVDMSLALVAGKQMLSDHGAVDSEEAGVLDVWCLLRVDPSVLPAINTAIVRPSSLKSQQHSSSMMEQMLDDEQSVDYRYSRDIHRRSKRPSEEAQSSRSEAQEKVAEINPSHNEVIENEVPTSIRSVNDLKQAIAKKSNDSASIYEMLKNKKWNRRSTLNSQKTLDGNRQKSVTICNQPKQSSIIDERNISQTTTNMNSDDNLQSLDITIQWLALNEDCRAMTDPSVRRLYVAYSFLGRSGAELETPVSLPKPKNYMDKCHFLFKKTFMVNECDMVALGQLSQCRELASAPDPQCSVVFSVVSEPAEDPLGLDSCEDVGYAYLYLGDVLSSSSSETYSGVLVVRDPRGVGCGALAVRIDGLGLLRRCRDLAGAGSD